MMRRESAGFSLIEVLVAFAISAIGLMGLATTQMLSVKNINNTQFRTLATIYAYDMAERMRSNVAGLQAGAYNAIDGKETAVSCSACTATQIAQQDAYEWNVMIKQDIATGGLPEGVGTVTNNAGVFSIVITWKEQVRASNGASIAGQSLTLGVRLL